MDNREPRPSTIFCADTSQSRGGWVLPAELLDRVYEVQAQNPSFTSRQCFEQLGAVYNPFVKHEPERLSFYLDPVETRRTRVADGVEYTGCWAMTEDKLAEVHRLKGEHGDWPWSKCFEEAGGDWILGYYRKVLDTEGLTEEQLFAHLAPGT